MNDIAAIKARREAITLDGWTSGWVDREMESGATCAWAEGPDHIDDDWDSATKLAAKDAAFIAAAPADIDTLLAEVERLTVALHDDAATKLGDAMLEASRLRREVTALTAERDALAQQLQQAQDAAKRQAAYISEWEVGAVVWLYEDNAGGLYIGCDGGPWYEVDGEPGKFDDDAMGFAYTDDMDLEYSVVDGKLDAEPQAKLVAKWEDGAVTVLNNTLVGSAPAGRAAAAYLGIKRE